MKRTAFALLLFAIPTVFWTILLFGFWPGLMSFDSIVQWEQLSTFRFADWHPVFHTLSMWLITRVWFSPAAVAMVQVLVYSSAVAYTLTIFRNLKVHWTILILTCIFFSAFILNGLLAITLWKDIPYSISMLLLTAYLLRILTTNGGWLNQWIHWVMLGLISAFVALFRHNGLPVSVITLLAVILLFRQQWKKGFAALLVFSLLYGFVKGPVYQMLNVSNDQAQAPGVALVHPIAAHVYMGGHFSEEEKAYLNNIYPLKDGWPYSCHDATILFYKGVNFTPVITKPLQAAQILLKQTLDHPFVTVRHFACLSSFLWSIPQPEPVYLETVILSNHDARTMGGYEAYYDISKPDSKLPAVNQLVIDLYQSIMQWDNRKILLRPAIYTYTLIIAILVLCLRNRSWKYSLLLLPLLVHSAVLVFALQLQAVRYQYPTYVISMLFTLPLLVLSIKHTEPA